MSDISSPELVTHDKQPAKALLRLSITGMSICKLPGSEKKFMRSREWHQSFEFYDKKPFISSQAAHFD